MKIRQVSVDKIIPYPGNPRKNQDAIDPVAASLREFGWRQPIVVDSDMVVIVGHTRLLAAQQLGLEKVPVTVADDMTAAQARAYRLADNRTGENAEWDNDLLAIELGELEGDFDLSLTGFSPDELRALMNVGTGGNTDEDDIPEPPAEPISALGDIWLMGPHRLVCGDSTDRASVDKLMDGITADLCLTDPPYGLGDGVASGKNQYIEYEDTRSNLIDLAERWVPLARDVSKVVVFSPGVTNQWLYPEPNWVMCWFYGGGQLRSPWGFNCWQPFLCYGKEPGLAAGQGMRPDSIDMNTPANSGDLNHPCPKPVKLWSWFLDRLVFSPSAVIFEPFAGSGTTFIAAEKKGIICYGSEITPLYIDVAIKRWQNFTGHKAIRESDGAEFDSLQPESAAA